MESRNARVVKNTLFLYGRMILLTIINRYTVRVTLDALGEMDYGIYTVVGSFVALFGIVTGTLTSASQRYLSFHLGKEDFAGYSHTFSMLLIGFCIVAAIVVAVAEVAGVFAFDGFLDIPANKIKDAEIVYQASLAAFVVNMLAIPFTASIISNERMQAFAYVSLIDGAMKLGLVFLLLSVSSGRLVLYGWLVLAESIIILFSYYIYCHRQFRYCRIKLVWDKGLLKELSSYTGWNLLGAMSGTLATQGQSVLLNVFFGPIINTAKGIADRIYNVIYSFSSNFYMAVNPQIIKSYAMNDLERMRELATRSSKLSFMLLFLLSLPLISAMDPLLQVWLGPDGKTPEMVGFSRLVLIQGLVVCLENPITQMIRATGKIKLYQIRVGVCTLMYIPIAWFVLKEGGSPLMTMVVLTSLTLAVQFVRIYQAHVQVGLDVVKYLKTVMLPIGIVGLIGTPLVFAIQFLTNESKFILCIEQGVSGLIVAIGLIWLIGLNRMEREFVISKAKNFGPLKKLQRK